MSKRIGLVNNGYISSEGANVSVNSSTAQVLLIFEMPASGTIEGIAFICGQGGGTGTGRIDLYAVGTNGLPTGSAIAYDASYSSYNYGLGSGTLDGTASVVAGTRYAAKITNPNTGSESTNYLQVAAITYGIFAEMYGSADSGTTWESKGVGSVAVKIDGVWWSASRVRSARVGLTSQPVYNDTGSPNTIRRTGVVFKRSEAYTFNRPVFAMYKVGSPTSTVALICEAWNGSTLLATSISKVLVSSISSTSATNPTYKGFHFNDISVDANTEIRYVVRAEGADDLDSSNYIALSGDEKGSVYPSGDANKIDGYLGGTFTSVGTPGSSDWTDYRTSSTNVLPYFELFGNSVQSSAGGGYSRSRVVNQ